MSTTRHGTPDYLLLALTVGLSIFGLVMVYSASFFIAVSEGHSQIYYLVRQSFWLTLGMLGLFIAQRIDYRIYRKWAVGGLVLTLVMLGLTLLLPESITGGGGAQRWLRIGPLQFQPAEVAKFTLIVYLAAWLISRGDDKLKSMSYGLIPFTLVVGLFCGLIVLQPNLSSAALLGLIACAIYFAAGANLLHIGAGILTAGGLMLVVIQFFGHAIDRLRVFQDPWIDPRGAGFQPIHSLYALASGGIFGRGLGQSREKFLWLYSAHADAIFSIIGEELGLIGTLTLVVVFVTLAYRGYRIAARCHDPFAALMAIGITTWISVQAFLNMAVVSSLIPYTGQTLPFISYGGTSLLMCLWAMGVLLNISKHVHEQPAQPIVSPIVERRRTLNQPRRRPIGLIPALAALVRRRHRGPRVSSPGRRYSFARTSSRPPTTVATRGWRRLSSGSASTRRRTRSTDREGSGGWRRR
ncbi:putative lipid II flippase FtsW [Kallotenue papyrolyticum]|uniref:putative lipid II flippase FtsW n=1 Tax=Kallotenue papyrolyticum TaxID=1325125 RepID=UPI00047859B7|nr:putative lipid II flippase FtsW [Kallotenue papyrolyticum]